MIIDDEELGFSNEELNMDNQLASSCSMDSIFDEILRDSHACTHTHTCNPPGPDLSHSHTCFHVHTKILPTLSEDKVTTDDTSESVETNPKKPTAGNREAVRKYREKKKVRAASLEDEVFRLRTINQQLMRKLHSQAALEAEVARLKCLLVDIRGRIEGEIGSFPYQKPTRCTDGISSLHPQSNLMGAYAVNECDLRCDDQVFCLHPGLENKGVGDTGGEFNTGEGFEACDAGYIACSGTANPTYTEHPGCGQPNMGSTAKPNPSAAKKGRGGAR